MSKLITPQVESAFYTLTGHHIDPSHHEDISIAHEIAVEIRLAAAFGTVTRVTFTEGGDENDLSHVWVYSDRI